MGTLFYAYKDNIYVNLTNKCTASCIFCLKNHKSGVGAAQNMFLERDPDIKEFWTQMDQISFDSYSELVFCGYGEPTCELVKLIAIAERFKERCSKKVRLNTNGLGRLYNGKDFLPDLQNLVDEYSISLNAPNEARYMEIVRPIYSNAFEEVQRFALDVKAMGRQAVFSVVDILTPGELEQTRFLAERLGIPLKVRKYED